MSLRPDQRRIGSGTVVALGIVGAAIALLALGRAVGWDPTLADAWRHSVAAPVL